ncbi:transcription termination/antitermination NusG family protein [Desulfoluna spongiiphila]|uniref:transcription termination/antitermination NusG family protein n=1 Tax=Desulfoluna spongiiphila TaxID=419481 RepID=UPI001254131A|nr:transcription termination/antitermination NusG family protein [Desulfoluna spongiiphila]VVS94563.1 nusg n-terminal [Desulfoluna spongiiphila]
MIYSHGFENWYVLHTVAGQEEQVAIKLNTLLNQSLSFYLPRKEVIHTVNGREKRVALALFPGYLFIQNDINALARFLCQRAWNGRVIPLSAQHRYLSVAPHEMEQLFAMAGPKGIIPVSKGVYEEGRVRIVHGPLKDCEGDILFFNRRKKKARVRISLVNRSLDVTLGLELVGAHCNGHD